MKWFNSLPRLVQILLLLIPGVNWVVEIVVRWSAALTHKDVGHILVALLVTIFGVVVGWLDVIWCLLFKHLVYAK
jgi:hypothetical protein